MLFYAKALNQLAYLHTLVHNPSMPAEMQSNVG
jgi:hypothetical protein